MEIQGLVSIIHKGPSKINSKAARDLLGKTSKILQQMLPLEGCAKDQSSWHDVQHLLQIMEKCKLESQWDLTEELSEYLT